MRVMVTGAGGMLADAVAALLEKRGDESLGVYFSDAEAEAMRGRFPHGVAFEFGRAGAGDGALAPFEEAVSGFRPEWIFHLAAWTDVDGCESDRARAVRSNADACFEAGRVAERHGARLLLISTDYVFDGLAARPYGEDDRTGPPSIYGQSKLAGETFVRASGVEYVVVRTAWLYGAGGRHFVDTIRARLEAGQPVRIVNDQRGCPTLTTDLALALRTLAERDARGIVNVVNSGDATWFELALEIARSMGREHLVSPISTEELNRPAPRPRYSVLNTSRYASLAGAPLPDWRDALGRYLALRTN